MRKLSPLPASIVLMLVSGSIAAAAGTSPSNSAQVARGKYLVSIISCTDCHTPGTLLGKPDFTRYLGGSEVGFEIPGLGVFYGPNLTPDKETGLGNWTDEQIATAITAGKRPDGRILAPAMPVDSFKNLSHADALAIAAYLKTLKPVSNKVPGPFGPSQKPTSFVFQVLPPNKYTPTVPPSASGPKPSMTPAQAPTPAAPMPSPASGVPAPVPTPAPAGAPVPMPTPTDVKAPTPGPATATPPQPPKQ